MTESGGNSGNMLYYGDNLDVLKLHVKDESVDLIYLDPPFKSNQDYNILFAEKDGSSSAAQIMAFEDTWHWDSAAYAAYEQVVTSGGRVAEAMEAFKRFLGQSDMMAYLSMMAPRLIELKRVLKPTGSIYLHCDPTASHYLKMLMDAVFGPENFVNEIIWKRTSAHNRTVRFGPVHDTILFYSKSDKWVWNEQFVPYDEDYLNSFYRHVEEGTGRRYRLSDVTSNRPGGSYLWNGRKPPGNRYWGYSEETMKEFEAQGRLVYSKTGIPSYKRYLDEMPGQLLQDVWTDIQPLSSQGAERLGYPTQKPEILLERILRASSNDGDTILDPFCGCGTTISVAQRINRRWIGIDITHLAITLMRNRLKDAFGDEVKYDVIGEPTDLAGARALSDLDKYQFQWWALWLVGARPTDMKKGADRGIDGRITFFIEKGKAEHIILSVKGGAVNVSHVRDLRGVVEREKAAIGVLISLEEPTGPMRAEAVEAGFYTSAELGNPKYQRIQLLTIKGLLEEGRRIESPHSVSSTAANITFKKAPKAKREPKHKEKQSKLSEHTE